MLFKVHPGATFSLDNPTFSAESNLKKKNIPKLVKLYTQVFFVCVREKERERGSRHVSAGGNEKVFESEQTKDYKPEAGNSRF